MKPAVPPEPPPAPRRPAQWLVGVLVLVVVLGTPVVVLADQQTQFQVLRYLLFVGVVVSAVVLVDGIAQLPRWWRAGPPVLLVVATVGGYLLGVAFLALGFLLAYRIYVLGGSGLAFGAAVLLEALAIAAALVLRRMWSTRIDGSPTS